MKIVVVTGNYYPEPSQNGVIADEIAKVFNSHKHQVEIICFDRGVYRSKQFKIHKLRTPHRSFQNIFKRKNVHIGAKIISIYRSFFKIFTNKNPDSWYSEKVFRKLKAINEVGEIDIIISLNSPIEGHIGSTKFCEEKNTKLVLYWLDQYSDVNSFYKYMIFKEKKYYKNIMMERKLSQRADLNLIPYTREKWVMEKLASSNFKIIDFPLSKKIDLNSNFTKNKIIYTGAFYKENRNPEKILDFFSNKIKELDLHLFWFGDCHEIIQKYENTSNIHNHNRVDKNTIDFHMEDTNFLLNLGNKNSTQLPSKLYEYMNYGKPIINIFYEDDYYPVLKDYPHYISIKYSEIDDIKNQQKFKNFINKYKDRTLIENSMEFNYKSTPEYLYKVILKEVYDD